MLSTRRPHWCPWPAAAFPFCLCSICKESDACESHKSQSTFTLCERFPDGCKWSTGSTRVRQTALLWVSKIAAKSPERHPAQFPTAGPTQGPQTSQASRYPPMALETTLLKNNRKQRLGSNPDLEVSSVFESHVSFQQLYHCPPKAAPSSSVQVVQGRIKPSPR